MAGAIEVLAARIEEVAQSAGPGREEVEAFAAELAERLFEFALAGYLDVHRPVVGHLFTIFGVIEVVPVAATPSAPAHTRESLHLDRLSRLIDDPVALLTGAVRLGQPGVRVGSAAAAALSAFLGRMTDFSFVQPGPAAVPAHRGGRHRAHRGPRSGLQAVLRLQTDAELDLILPLGEAAALTAADAALEQEAAVAVLPRPIFQVRPPTTEVSGSVRAGPGPAPRRSNPGGGAGRPATRAWRASGCAPPRPT